MILPTKHISESQALVGIGAVLIDALQNIALTLIASGGPHTVTGLWEKVRDLRVVGTFERFVLALDMLFILGLVRLSEGLIEREKA